MMLVTEATKIGGVGRQIIGDKDGKGACAAEDADEIHAQLVRTPTRIADGV